MYGIWSKVTCLLDRENSVIKINQLSHIIILGSRWRNIDQFIYPPQTIKILDKRQQRTVITDRGKMNKGELYDSP